MLTKRPVPYDFCVGVPISRLVGAFSLIVQPVVEPMDRFTALLFSFSSFVTDQLHPTFEIFGPEELEVVLKPFGKANVGIVA